ncbi:RidA family protein [Psychromicrobium xiongbiense]|uniref:RidA family protein n=1 Tax=Psychromicrobium xiongbiense TaxID=3051184 RepID=UPI002552E228|nr:RidA family protein [Psychromicrobium sp. YIM S02556]
MSVELHRSQDLSEVAEYAYASSTEASRLVFTAGACPLDSSGQVPPSSISEQAELCMDNLTLALRAAGSDLNAVLKTTVYVASSDRGELVEAWNAVRAAMGEHDAPSTLLGVTVLGYPNQRVEVEAVAVGTAP